MAPKPCPYRKEHEWDWDGALQTWVCRHCYAACETRPAPLVTETPTPTQPFPALRGPWGI